MVFYDGGARKWTRGRDWISGAYLWKPVKSIELKRWHLNYGQTRDDFFAGVSWDEIAGSCLEYAQAQEAFDTLRDPIEYLGLYVKHPQCEYIWGWGTFSANARWVEKRRLRGCLICGRHGRTNW